MCKLGRSSTTNVRHVSDRVDIATTDARRIKIYGPALTNRYSYYGW